MYIICEKIRRTKVKGKYGLTFLLTFLVGRIGTPYVFVYVFLYAQLLLAASCCHGCCSAACCFWLPAAAKCTQSPKKYSPLCSWQFLLLCPYALLTFVLNCFGGAVFLDFGPHTIAVAAAVAVTAAVAVAVAG